MTRLMITSDLHLGHKNIHKFRTGFDSAEHHHEVMFENLAMNIQKRDSLILLGDIAFDKYWLEKIASIKCEKKLLICGNHDTENGIKTLKQKLLKQVDDYNYLGSFISSSLKDFITRKGMTWSACNDLNKIWKSHLSSNIKLHIF